MKVYNLTSSALHFKKDGEDCFCALGIFAAERGCPVEQLAEDDYSFFKKPEHQEDLAKIAGLLAPLAGISPDEIDEQYSVVHYANDNRDWEKYHAATGIKMLPFRVPAEKIREALATVGIKVKLIDKRGQW